MLPDTEKLLLSYRCGRFQTSRGGSAESCPSPVDPEEHWPEETDLRNADVGDFFLNLDIFINP